MRRVLALLVLTLLVSPAAAAAGGSEIVFRTAEFSYDDLVPGICEFPIRFVGTQEHWQKLQYRNLPDGLGTDEPGAEVYQVAGWHFTSTRETISNPANGRSVDLHSEDQLMRRDFDFHFTYDAVGQPTGYFTATDHNSYSYTATARGGPPVFKYCGPRAPEPHELLRRRRARRPDRRSLLHEGHLPRQPVRVPRRLTSR